MFGRSICVSFILGYTTSFLLLFSLFDISKIKYEISSSQTNEIVTDAELFWMSEDNLKTVSKNGTEQKRNKIRQKPTERRKIFKDKYASNEILNASNDEHWQKAFHYNIDDYGVPIEEFLYSVENMKKMTPEQRLLKLKERGIKTVLYYHSAYGSKTYGFNDGRPDKQGQLPYIMKNCKRKDCFCTDQRNFIPIQEFDAILFYSRAISKSDIPKVRKPHQRYILWEVEPASYLMGFNPSSWNNFFNWTHTYRRDSDIWEPWGLMNQFKPFPKDVESLIEVSKINTTQATRKTKSVAWFVSNCRAISGRDNYARELQKYIPVDIYGRCGPLKCDRSVGDKCWNDIEKDYHFYFSAENSLCKDYITEKFYNALKKKVIPIVFGGAEKEDYYLAPRKSHINTIDYKSPQQLAKYLKYLEKNTSEYMSYFWWKPYYNIWLGRWKKAHCEICDKLHSDEPKKIYIDMRKWWVTQAKCRQKYN